MVQIAKMTEECALVRKFDCGSQLSCCGILAVLLERHGTDQDEANGLTLILMCSFTVVVLRLKASWECVTIRYKVKTGFNFVCKSHPFTSQIEAALNKGLDIKGSLMSLVKFAPTIAVRDFSELL